MMPSVLTVFFHSRGIFAYDFYSDSFAQLMTVVLAVNRKRFCVIFHWSMIYHLTDFYYTYRYLTCRYYARMHDYIPRTPFQDYILEFVYSCSWGPFWVDTAEVCINEQTGRKFTPLMHLNSVLGGPFGLGGPRRTLEEAATWWGCTAGNPAEFLSVCWLWSENFQWQSIHSIPQLQSDG